MADQRLGRMAGSFSPPTSQLARPSCARYSLRRRNVSPRYSTMFSGGGRNAIGTDALPHATPAILTTKERRMTKRGLVAEMRKLTAASLASLHRERPANHATPGSAGTLTRIHEMSGRPDPERPRPFTYQCEDCGWHTTVAPASYDLQPHEVRTQCENCGNPSLQRRTPSRLQALMATLKRDLGNRPSRA